MTNNDLPDMKKIVAPIVAQEVTSRHKIVFDETSPSIAVFATDDGTVRVEARLMDGSVWLSQKLMAQLYGVRKQTISHHLKEIFEDGELNENSVVKEYLTTATDGKNYKIKLYSLDAIIHVGYRVRSSVAALFRAWATERLREYMVISGHTAAEIKCFRARADMPNMGLTHWRGDMILIQDIDIAKNFLNLDELDKLNRLVTMFLDHAELRAFNHQDMTLADWQAQTEKFLTFYEYPVLQGYGTRRAEQAKKYVREQFALYKDRMKVLALHKAEQEDALENVGENE